MQGVGAPSHVPCHVMHYSVGVHIVISRKLLIDLWIARTTPAGSGCMQGAACELVCPACTLLILAMATENAMLSL